MSTSVGIGSGAQFWLDDASDVLTQLSEVITVALPNPQIADVDATHMLSTAKEFISGLKDYGDGTVEMNYIPGSATDVLIRAAVADGVARDFKTVLKLADASYWHISGMCIVKSYDRSAPIDNRMTATMTVRFTGSPTEATGS